MEIKSVITWVLLGVGSVFDLNDKKIPFLLIVLGAFGGGIFAWRNGMSLNELLFALLPGVGLLLVGFLTGEKIGYGDGLMIIVLGLLEGGLVCLWDMGIALLLLALFVTVLVIVKRADRSTMVPMVPFVLLAHIVNYFIKG